MVSAPRKNNYVLKKKSTYFYTSFDNMKVNGGGIHILLYNLGLYIE